VWTTLLWILVLIVVGIFVFKMIKSVIKTLMVMTLVVALILIIILSLVYSDTINLKKKFTSDPVLIIYQEHGELQTGIRLSSLSGGNATFISGLEINNMQTSYYAGNYKDIADANYKVFFVIDDTFKEIEGPVSDSERSYTKNFTINLIESDDPLGMYISNQLGGEVSDETKRNIATDLGFEDPTLLKSQMFGLLYEQMLDEKGLTHLFLQYKKGTVEVYPETAFFKFINAVPVSFVGKLVGEAKEKVKDTAKDKIAETLE